jgi:hypothetical protein
MYETSSGGTAGIFVLLIVFAFYFYFAFAQYKIAQKLGHGNAWYAFVPILNTIQLIQMAHKPMIWLLFLLLPVVNVVCFAILWINVAKMTGYSPAVGFFVLIPPISLITIGIMAFGQGKQRPSPFPPHDHTKPKQPQSVA